MRRILLLTFFIVLSFVGFGQKPVINLKFSGDYLGTYVKTDSILVRNLTLGGDTVLFYPDTLLMLEYNTGIEQIMFEKDGFFLEQNYPNPFTGKTLFTVWMARAGMMQISIAGLDGKELLNSHYKLAQGKHDFEFTGGDHRNYIISVISGQHIQTIKLIQASVSTNYSCSIVYRGFEDGLSLKSGTRMSGFKYAFGNQLHYTGYARNPAMIPMSGMITDIPQSDASVAIKMLEGLPCPDMPMVYYGGKYYPTVQIGYQCWMKENLSYNIVNSYCYDDLTTNCETYGRLYKWSAASIACPSGWRLPDTTDYNTLFGFLGGISIAASKMKVPGTLYWNAPNTNADNYSGFSALPGGVCQSSGDFDLKGSHGLFWTDTENTSSRAYNIALYAVSSGVTMPHNTKELGLSVRCIKEQ